MTKLAPLLFAATLALAGPAVAAEPSGGHGGHAGGGHGPGGDFSRGPGPGFDAGRWQGGHWFQGDHGGRFGWWWSVGPDWYWYAAPAYPFPEPYVAPGGAVGMWYWCQDYRAYYPYVATCPTAWWAVPAQ